MNRPLYARIAVALHAQANCDRRGNTEWRHRHAQTAINLVKEYMPSGGGIDNGVTLDFETSTPDRLVFATSFHHMDDNGFYDGWTEHGVIITPSLSCGFDIRVSGRDRNEIKDYLADTFSDALRRELADDECLDCYTNA